MSIFARPFRIVLPDGRQLDGVQFPSGRVVVDDCHAGMFNAATSVADLNLGPHDRIEWEAPDEDLARIELEQLLALDANGRACEVCGDGMHDHTWATLNGDGFVVACSNRTLLQGSPASRDPVAE